MTPAGLQLDICTHLCLAGRVEQEQRREPQSWGRRPSPQRRVRPLLGLKMPHSQRQPSPRLPLPGWPRLPLALRKAPAGKHW